MSNVKLTWTLPNVSSRQKPIKHTMISVRVDPSLPWTDQTPVAPDGAQEINFIDVAPGTYYYRGIVEDVDGKAGDPVETSVTVPFDPPGVISSFTATLS